MHSSDASLYTRPLALVLQNSWVAGMAGNAPPLAGSPGETACNRRAQAPRLTMFTLLKRTARDMDEVLRETNLKREQRWLAARLRDR